MVKKWFLMLLIGSMAAFSQEIALIGTVKDSKGAAIKDASVSLVNEAELNTTTDSEGVFKLEKVGVRNPYSVSVRNTSKVGVKGKLLQFTVASEAKSGTIEIFSANGRRNAIIPLGKLAAGSHTQEIPSLTSGLYIMNITLDQSVTTFRLVNSGNGMSLSGSTNNISGSILRTAAVMASVDTLVVSKEGYVTKRIGIEKYIDDKVQVVLEEESVEPVECTLPNLPSTGELKSNPKLPDPFTFFDGTKLTKKEQWACRRAEILAMAEKYLYGPMPADPDEITGTVTSNSITATVKVGSKSTNLTFNTSGSGDILCLVTSAGISPSGARTYNLGGGNSSAISTLYGMSGVTGTIAAAWTAKIICAVVEQNPDAGIDPDKIMVTGCSGAGKVAMTTGAFCEGIDLTVIVESGGGGAASFRQVEWFRHGAGGNIWKCSDAKPQGIDNLEANGLCGPWVSSSAAGWVTSNPSNVNKLPFDQHLMLACIAPRAACHVTNSNGPNAWCHLGGTCEALSAWAAEPVWNALGVPDNFGFSIGESYMHCSVPAAYTTLANKFFDRVFKGNTSAETDVMIIPSGNVQQPQSEWKEMWVDWDMETKLD